MTTPEFVIRACTCEVQAVSFLSVASDAAPLLIVGFVVLLQSPISLLYVWKQKKNNRPPTERIAALPFRAPFSALGGSLSLWDIERSFLHCEWQGHSASVTSIVPMAPHRDGQARFWR